VRGVKKVIMELSNEQRFETKFFYSELTKPEILKKEFTCNFRYYIEINYLKYSKVYRFYDYTHLFEYTFNTEKQLKITEGPYKEKLKIKFNTLVQAIKQFTKH